MPVNRIGIETDLDKCLDTLAQARLDISMCKDDCCSCQGCPTLLYFNEEYNKLPPIDRLKVDQLARQKQQALKVLYHSRPTLLSKVQDTIRGAAVIIFIIASFIGVLLFLGTCRSFSGRAPADYTYPSIQTAQDVNNDGKVNCIDYAITYKVWWDTNNPGSAYRCEIVRNVNKASGMNHLFVRVRNKEHVWIYIEPQQGCTMEEFWGTRYNPVFNIYGETEYWLKQAGYKYDYL